VQLVSVQQARKDMSRVLDAVAGGAGYYYALKQTDSEAFRHRYSSTSEDHSVPGQNSISQALTRSRNFVGSVGSELTG